MCIRDSIETANKTKQLKVVVDTSQPISIQPKNQTDLDVLIKLDLIDSEDMEMCIRDRSRATHVLQWRKQREARPRGGANPKNNV